MRTMKIVKMKRSASIEECIDIRLPDVDAVQEPDDERPFWEPDCADDVDKLVAAQVMRSNHYKMLELQAKASRLEAENRIQRIVNAYQDRLQCAMPADGKKRGAWAGPHSGGKYTGQRDRVSELAISDRAAVAAAGFLRTCVSMELDKAAVRSSGLTDSELAARGVAVTPQADVKFTGVK